MGEKRPRRKEVAVRGKGRVGLWVVRERVRRERV